MSTCRFFKDFESHFPYRLMQFCCPKNSKVKKIVLKIMLLPILTLTMQQCWHTYWLRAHQSLSLKVSNCLLHRHMFIVSKLHSKSVDYKYSLHLIKIPSNFPCYQVGIMKLMTNMKSRWSQSLMEQTFLGTRKPECLLNRNINDYIWFDKVEGKVVKTWNKFPFLYNINLYCYVRFVPCNVNKLFGEKISLCSWIHCC